jgi:hypothetical protein
VVATNKTAKIFDISFGFNKRNQKDRAHFQHHRPVNFTKTQKSKEGPFAHTGTGRPIEYGGSYPYSGETPKLGVSDFGGKRGTPETPLLGGFQTQTAMTPTL